MNIDVLHKWSSEINWLDCMKTLFGSSLPPVVCVCLRRSFFVFCFSSSCVPYVVHFWLALRCSLTFINHKTTSIESSFYVDNKSMRIRSFINDLYRTQDWELSLVIFLFNYLFCNWNCSCHKSIYFIWQ